jgi:hypothetical protein
MLLFDFQSAAVSGGFVGFSTMSRRVPAGSDPDFPHGVEGGRKKGGRPLDGPAEAGVEGLSAIDRQRV